MRPALMIIGSLFLWGACAPIVPTHVAQLGQLCDKVMPAIMKTPTVAGWESLLMILVAAWFFNRAAAR